MSGKWLRPRASFSPRRCHGWASHAGFAMTSLPHKRIEEPLLAGAARGIGRRCWWRLKSHRKRRLDRRAARLDCPADPPRSPDRGGFRTGDLRWSWAESMRLAIRMGFRRRQGYKLVAEQADRTACRLTFLTQVPGAELRQNGAFVQNAITLTTAAGERQRALWQDRVRLDDGFWRSTENLPSRSARAVRAIGAWSLALDGMHIARVRRTPWPPTPVPGLLSAPSSGLGSRAVRPAEADLPRCLGARPGGLSGGQGRRGGDRGGAASVGASRAAGRGQGSGSVQPIRTLLTVRSNCRCRPGWRTWPQPSKPRRRSS